MQKLIVNCDPTKEALSLVRQAGWDGVHTMPPEDAGAFAAEVRRQGLIYSSIHAPFGGAASLWGEEGEGFVKEQIACLEDAARAKVPLVVMHAIIGMEKVAPSEREKAFGIENFGRILAAAEKLGISVALENTEGFEYLAALMAAYASCPSLGFCWDSGHEQCYNGARDVLAPYAGRLFYMHLNDNKGVTGDTITFLDDAHLLPFDGVSDWERNAARLKATCYHGPLVFEISQENMPGRHANDRYEVLSYAEYLALALSHARRFAALMEE